MRQGFRDVGVVVVMLVAAGAVVFPGLVLIEALTGMPLPFSPASAGRWGVVVVACVGGIAYARRRAYGRHAAKHARAVEERD